MRKKSARKVLRPRQLREWAWGHAFILPWLIGTGVFFVYAMANSINFTVHSMMLDNGIVLKPLEHFWDNYAYILTHVPSFAMALQSFCASLVLKVPMIVSFALMIALLLNGNFRGRGFFRLLFFLPVIIATGPVMTNLSSQGVNGVSIYSVSALSNILSQLPEEIFNVFEDLFSQLITILWQSGIQMLIFLAGLQKNSPTLYEAAKIDGASAWETFWKITIPLVRPLVLLNTIYTIVFLSSSSNEVITQIEEATYSTQLGYSYAMAMSWMYAVVIALLLLVVFLVLRERSDKHVKFEQTLDTIREQTKQKATTERAG